MRVKDLIRVLEDCDQEAEVRFAYGYGDRIGTTCAPVVKRVDETNGFAWSEYHRSDVVIDEEHSRFDEDQPFSVLLSA